MKGTHRSISDQPKLHIVQDAYSQVREMVALQLRGAALKLVHGLFDEEVERLCGAPFVRKGAKFCHRGGSEKGSLKLQGQRLEVCRPRVRQDHQEVELQSYGALQDFDLLCERVMSHMLRGVSTRNYDDLLEELEGGLGLKKSSVSKAFQKGSQQALEEINGRDLGVHDFVALMIDGIEFGDRTVIAALGITHLGEKVLLGLREGDTENWEVCKDLLRSLVERGLDRGHPFLWVIDGSKALRKAIRKVFGKLHPVQRCIRHKERNCLKYLSKGYHMEFRRRWKKLHGCAQYSDAQKEYDKLVVWLGGLNHEALQSLEEAEGETRTVLQLNLPGALKKTLLSTNPLESVFAQVQGMRRRVTNWKAGRDQVSRWAAVTLLEAEKKFRKIRGYKEIPLLLAELEKLSVEKQRQVA